jgi:hypothetical protein
MLVVILPVAVAGSRGFGNGFPQADGRRPRQFTADRSRKCITKPHFSWRGVPPGALVVSLRLGGLWVLLSAQQPPVLGDLAL